MSKDRIKANRKEAVHLINRLHTRANLPSIKFTQELSEVEILTSIMEERSIEFIGEGKRWYDILRFGRRHNNKYKSIFLVENVLKYNSQASQSWLNSVLINDDALFLPVWDKELKRNNKLTQNPYYN